MSTYFISPKEVTDLRINARELTDVLSHRWPDATIQFTENTEEINSVTWSVPMGHGELEGALEREGQAIVLDGDVRDAADFARWARQQASDRYELYFYNQAYTAEVPLTVSTPSENLVRPFLVRG